MATTTQDFHPGKKSEQRQDLKDVVKDVIKGSGDQTKGQGKHALEKGAAELSAVVQDSMSKAAQLSREAAEQNSQLLQKGIEAASHNAKESTDRLSKTLGFTGADAEHLVHQCQTNVEAVGRCTTVIVNSLHDVSRSWFEFGEKQWRRNLEAVDKLARVKSVQEFTAVQSEFIRESLQHALENSRTLSERSSRTSAEANKILSGATGS